MRVIRQLQDNLPKGEGPRTSTYGGRALVTASGLNFRQILISDNYKNSRMYSVPWNIRSMRFTSDDHQLLLACESKLVIMNTTTMSWFIQHTIDYPCHTVTSVAISPFATLVACGSTDGNVWLWEASTNCWVRRLMPKGGPHQKHDAIQNINFAATGSTVLFNYPSNSFTQVVKTTPLDQIAITTFRVNLITDHGPVQDLQTGMRVMDPSLGFGATAFGGPGGSSVVCWETEPRREQRLVQA